MKMKKFKKTTAKRVTRSSKMKSQLVTMLQNQASINNFVAALSTGVINKSTAVTIAHTEILNRRNSAITVRVIVINWDSGSPVVLSTTNRVIPANTFSSFSTNVGGIQFHYEVVVLTSRTSNVIINNFGTNAAFVPQEGSTVLNNDLVRISI
ncbi:hypothetical protein [Paenibacillus glycanilyticus]|uniref:Uncharacterized protein n=1 Tax=Paenibacillus glycanilyticus TaxID=126569 RepID=A0ABQ6NI97_9BACL|nr:hypothetical protein [Paenibacillus glycanilyticus]GMK43927.1 hypothetical protein PghCCS26_10540 [Paenibacillus glycanilyticus]